MREIPLYPETGLAPGKCELRKKPRERIQGYLAHKKTTPP